MHIRRHKFPLTLSTPSSAHNLYSQHKPRMGSMPEASKILTFVSARRSVQADAKDPRGCVGRVGQVIKGENPLAVSLAQWADPCITPRLSPSHALEQRSQSKTTLRWPTHAILACFPARFRAHVLCCVVTAQRRKFARRLPCLLPQQRLTKGHPGVALAGDRGPVGGDAEDGL